MEASRIAALLDPFLDTPLTAPQLDQISTYIDLLIRWNSRINLTAIRTPDEIVTRHFGESLFAARHLFPCGADTPVRPPEPSPSPLASLNPPPHTPQTQPLLLDIGSGAGFPGLPIKIWSPATAVTLIESNHKKVSFLREVLRALTLTDINVSPTRAEDLPASQASIITLRAVEHFDRILPAAVRLLAPAGRMALLISEPQLTNAARLSPTLRWAPKHLPHSAARILAIGTRI